MKIIQSFWAGNQKDFTNSYGWLDYKYNWMSWILSCHQLVKYHKDVELFTDSFGYEILIEKLQLPYTKVHVVLDELNDYHKDLWALAKIRTFQLQNEPFLHVDGDVFVWESLTDKFSNSNLVTQNLEVTTGYYRNRWDAIRPNINYLPEEMKGFDEDTCNLACNMGIIGGTNIEFFQDFCARSIEFVDQNTKAWSDQDNLNFNVFFEQVFFYGACLKSNQKIDFLFQETPKDNLYIGFGDFDKVPYRKTYLHLLGVYKRHGAVCKAMEIYVMQHYTEMYSKLMGLINELNLNTKEIDYLTKDNVFELVTEFEEELKTNQFESENFLLKRDLYGGGLTQIFDFSLEEKDDFNIVLLNCFYKKTIIEKETSIDIIEIKENNSVYNQYEVDEIDLIMLDELSKPTLYSDFIEKLKTYFDDDTEEDSDDEFLLLINNRLRNYLVYKIISIYLN